MKVLSIRNCYILGFLTCAFLLGFAFYLEYHLGLMPCPLCQLQRIALGFVGLFFLVGIPFVPHRFATWFFGYAISLFAFLGMLAAGRQIYLQHFATAAAGDCSAGLTYLFSVLPFGQALAAAFKGSDDCAQITWQLLGLSIADWTFIAFFALAVFALLQNHRNKK